MSVLSFVADRITITEPVSTDAPWSPRAGVEPVDGVSSGPTDGNPPDDTPPSPRSAVVVVDGEGCAHCRDTGDTSDGRPCWKCGGRGYFRLPPEQVRRLTEPCQTAAASLSDPHAGHDCRDGRPTFTLHQRFVEATRCVDAHPFDHRHCSANTHERVVDLGSGWVVTDVQPCDDGSFAVSCEQAF